MGEAEEEGRDVVFHKELSFLIYIENGYFTED